MVGPSSTTTPAYMTTARALVSAIMPMSWVTITSARPRRVGELRQQVADLRLHDHVESRGGLVGEEHLGLAGQRHGDDGALAHAAGELVRVAPRDRRRQADQLEQLARCAAAPAPSSAARAPPWGRRSACRPGTPGSSRSSPPGRPWRRASSAPPGRSVSPRGEHVDAVEEHAAADRGEGGQQAHGREDHGGLAAARLAEHADALAGVDGRGRRRARRAPSARRGRRTTRAGRRPRARCASSRRRSRGRLHVDGLHASSSAVARRRLKLFGETWALPRRGFMASSTPCPIRKLPSTTRAMQTPGGTIAHQAPDGHRGVQEGVLDDRAPARRAPGRPAR